ncbi:hypothetical protein D7Z26_04935 [Cohnella endophytica]|uniref:Uncharacterized protein n=1 Tax=Cohnella endophytica TaxID=2419778 RepID=A0A494Y9G6_9BACL|nr:hypothetical protein [Cohnella endophytica]RKP57323.1 hypothetical protein D7Z26_04935 [Cohnella endophytica]
MIKNDIYAQATLTLNVSFRITARSKTHALEMAAFQVNKENILLDWIQLENIQGIKEILKVECIESILWTQVYSTEYSNQFKVAGSIRLMLRKDTNKGNLTKTAYRLPRSTIQEKPIWVLPTSYEPIFTQVLHQSLEWNSESRESKELIEA